METRSIAIVALVCLLAAGTKFYLQGAFENKDGTAQGLAKIRHYEALHKPSTRLYYDPYACYMYEGSFVQTWLGEGGTRWIYNLLMKGLLEHLTIRTKWLDDEIMKAIHDKNATQMVILGAGYDTRGFRLDLPHGFSVIEVDQPAVQSMKRKKLETISKEYEQIASRMNPDNGIVKFLEIDFNTDSVGVKLTKSNSPFNQDKPTIVILEGVTQYIPKTSTASTLAQLRKIIHPHSTLLVSYVPSDVFDDPAKCGPINNVNTVLKVAKYSGEPWISGWTAQEFKSFLDKLGYEVISDSIISELSDKYLAPINRSLDSNEILSIERYVKAIVKTDD